VSVRVGLVGCGAIARRSHLPGLRAADADVVAFASRSRASAEAAAGDWGSGAVFDDWAALIADPTVEAVDVCSPNRSHAEVAVAAAEAGKHVLVEKPMACTLEEADRMIAAARRSGVVLAVAHNVRFTAPFFTAHLLVAEGAVGEVVGFRAAFGHGGPQDWAPEATWFFDVRQSGGGALIDLGIHVADLIRFVVADEASDVSALLSRRSDGVDDAAQVIMRMAGGAVGSFHASWKARPGPDHQLTVFGTEATLHLDRRTPLSLHRPGGKPEPVEPHQPPGDLFTGFVAACASGSAPPVTAADGRAALAIVDAAYRSDATGRTVSPA
jgi:UDP-N-acetylglucosamine 3-dehydrogenase